MNVQVRDSDRQNHKIKLYDNRAWEYSSEWSEFKCRILKYLYHSKQKMDIKTCYLLQKESLQYLIILKLF